MQNDTEIVRKAWEALTDLDDHPNAEDGLQRLYDALQGQEVSDGER